VTLIKILATVALICLFIAWAIRKHLEVTATGDPRVALRRLRGEWTKGEDMAVNVMLVSAGLGIVSLLAAIVMVIWL